MTYWQLAIRNGSLIAIAPPVEGQLRSNPLGWKTRHAEKWATDSVAQKGAQEFWPQQGCARPMRVESPHMPRPESRNL
jgi:hypothetical protein